MLQFFSQVYAEQVELMVELILCTIYIRLFSLNLLTLPFKVFIISFTVSNYLVFLLRLSSKTRVWDHNLLGGLDRRNYCEDGPASQKKNRIVRTCESDDAQFKGVCYKLQRE